jgi:hypothetical protein
MRRATLKTHVYFFLLFSIKNSRLILFCYFYITYILQVIKQLISNALGLLEIPVLHKIVRWEIVARALKNNQILQKREPRTRKMHLIYV